MGCKPGHKKGGRKKGVPNKMPVFSVRDRLIAQDYDLIGNILADLQAINDPVQRTKIHLQLLEYCTPRIKPIEEAPAPTDGKTPLQNDLNQKSTEELLAIVKNEKAA